MKFFPKTTQLSVPMEVQAKNSPVQVREVVFAIGIITQMQQLIPNNFGLKIFLSQQMVVPIAKRS
jgi:hypothetical protein